jgi:threonine dehydrogenase-like Zn-dependent dehydrogenase
MQKTISVFGLGYVGCVSAACFANAGYNVIGVDVNADKVDMINAGTSPIVEPGLAPLISDMVLSGRLRATTSCAEAIAGSDLAFICVGTPGNRNGQVGFQALDRVCWEIGMALREKEQAFTQHGIARYHQWLGDESLAAWCRQQHPPTVAGGDESGIHTRRLGLAGFRPSGIHAGRLREQGNRRHAAAAV